MKLYKIKIATAYLLFVLHTNAHADLQDNLQMPAVLPNSNVPAPTLAAPTQKKQPETQSTPIDNSNSDLTKHDSNAPVYFQGNSADGSRKTGIYNLIGAVVITQDDTKLTSDNAQIISTPGSGVTLAGPTAVQKAIATGNVHVYKKGVAQEIKAQADKIEFLVPEGIMILTGNAKVWKGQELINASTMLLNIKNGDIKLQDPHGTIDPHSTSQFKTTNSAPRKN